MTDIAQALFRASTDIRYVAIYRGEAPLLSERPGLQAASSSESDRYEELLVNPALLTLTRQRGEIDCGGLEYVLVRYGNFFQLVHAVRGGASVRRDRAPGGPAASRALGAASVGGSGPCPAGRLTGAATSLLASLVLLSLLVSG